MDQVPVTLAMDQASADGPCAENGGRARGSRGISNVRQQPGWGGGLICPGGQVVSVLFIIAGLYATLTENDWHDRVSGIDEDDTVGQPHDGDLLAVDRVGPAPERPRATQHDRSDTLHKHGGGGWDRVVPNVIAATALRLAAEIRQRDEREHVDVFARVLAGHAVQAGDGGHGGRAEGRAAVLQHADGVLGDLNLHGLAHACVLGRLLAVAGAVLLGVGLRQRRGELERKDRGGELHWERREGEEGARTGRLPSGRKPGRGAGTMAGGTMAGTIF